MADEPFVIRIVIRIGSVVKMMMRNHYFAVLEVYINHGSVASWPVVSKQRQTIDPHISSH